MGREKKETPTWEITTFYQISNGKMTDSKQLTSELLELKLFTECEMPVIAITLFLSTTWETDLNKWSKRAYPPSFRQFNCIFNYEKSK